MSGFEASSYIPTLMFLILSLIVLRSLKSIEKDPMLVLLGAWISVFSCHALVVAFQILPMTPIRLETSALTSASITTLLISYCIHSTILHRFMIQVQDNNSSSNVKPKLETSRIRRNLVVYSFSGYCLYAAFAMYSQAKLISSTDSIFSSLQLIRYRIHFEGMTWGGAEYFGTSTTVLSVYLFYLSKRWPLALKAMSLISLSCAMLIAVISTQRTSILMLIIALTFSASKGRLPKSRTAMIGIASFTALFGVVGFLVGKVETSDTSSIAIIEGGLQSLLVYALSPLSALSEIITAHHIQHQTGYTYRFFIVLAEQFGIDLGEPSLLVQPFVYVPFATNVYTFSHAPFSDFGYLYPIYFYVVGAILAIIFSTNNQTPPFVLLRAFSYYPIIMSIFQDQFFTILSTWIQIIFLLQFCHMSLPDRKKTNN